MDCLYNAFCCLRNKKLLKYTKNTKLFNFENQIKRAKVVKVYDGDTIHVVFYHNDDYYRFKCRLNRIDTPEIKSKLILEKRKANEVKNILKIKF